MWRSGFFFHEMAFGLLSVFLPLYVLEVTGGVGALVATGLMVTLANLAAIPSAYMWGYLCEKTQRYKPFILFSFLSTSIVIYLFTFSNTLTAVIALYVALNVFHAAHEPPKNVLIAEYYPRREWERNYASYEALTELGKVTGLLLGFFIAGAGLGSASVLYASSLLNLAGLAAATVFLADPALVFERSLVSIERTLGIAQKGFTLVYKSLEGERVNGRLRDNTNLFFIGLTVFSIATSMLFTPLPIFFGQTLTLSSSMVFAVFLLNSLGGVAGYIVAEKKANTMTEKPFIAKTLLLRAVMTFLLVPAAAWHTALTTTVAVLALLVLGCAYALFLVSTLAVSMVLAPRNAGLFNALNSLGSAAGCFIGPYVAQGYGFTFLFAAAGAGFLLSFASFKAFSTQASDL